MRQEIRIRVLGKSPVQAWTLSDKGEGSRLHKAVWMNASGNGAALSCLGGWRAPRSNSQWERMLAGGEVIQVGHVWNVLCQGISFKELENSFLKKMSLFPLTPCRFLYFPYIFPQERVIARFLRPTEKFSNVLFLSFIAKNPTV